MDGPRTPLAVAVLVTALVVQISVLNRLPLPGGTPDLMLLTVVALALVHGSGYGAVAGFCGGLALDLAPPADHAIGRWAFVLTVVGHVAGYARDHVERSAFAPFPVVIGASIGSLFLWSAIGALLGDDRVSAQAVAQVLPSIVLYDLILTPFVVYGVLALARRTDAAGSRR